MDLTEKLYIEAEHVPFTIDLVELIRDGGTIAIRTKHGFPYNPPYFIHKDEASVHSAYPPTAENKITDKLVLDYIRMQYAKYLEKKEQELNRAVNIYNTKLLNA